MALQVEGIDVRDGTITIRDTERLAAACGLDPLIDDPETYVCLQDTVGYPGMGQNHSHSIVPGGFDVTS